MVHSETSHERSRSELRSPEITDANKVRSLIWYLSKLNSCRHRSLRKQYSAGAFSIKESNFISGIQFPGIFPRPDVLNDSFGIRTSLEPGVDRSPQVHMAVPAHAISESLSQVEEQDD